MQQTSPGKPKHTSARVLSFETDMDPKECLGILQAIANLLTNYQRKDHSQ